MLFSQRNNIVTPPKNLKLDEISDDLKNSLWNALTEWKAKRNLYDTCYSIWKHFFKLAVDKMPYRTGITDVSYEAAWEKIRYFFFSAQWYEIFDLIEFVLQLEHSDKLDNEINRILISELTSYRVVNKQIIPVSNQDELSSLSQSINLEGPFENVAKHFQTALSHLSNRQNPDFRNSIKESISAVEAMAKVITGLSNATLDDALKQLEKEQKLHRSLKKGYQALYGYTCNSDGIRHSLMEESNLTLDDAKYFLISCSAFVNYLKTLSI